MGMIEFGTVVIMFSHGVIKKLLDVSFLITFNQIITKQTSFSVNSVGFFIIVGSPASSKTIIE